MREELIERGRQLQWHPDYMRHRFETWVNRLTGDWCISRQRFFGVPFPLWYRVGSEGAVDYSRPIVPGIHACRSIHPPMFRTDSARTSEVPPEAS